MEIPSSIFFLHSGEGDSLPKESSDPISASVDNTPLQTTTPRAPFREEAIPPLQGRDSGHGEKVISKGGSTVLLFPLREVNPPQL